MPGTIISIVLRLICQLLFFREAFFEWPTARSRIARKMTEPNICQIPKQSCVYILPWLFVFDTQLRCCLDLLCAAITKILAMSL